MFDSTDRARRAGQVVRVIDYTLQDSATPVQGSYRRVTNILDPQAAPALELAPLYHERREIEGVFDEFKMHLRANSTVLRSKTAELVEQELWPAAGALRHPSTHGASRMAARARPRSP